MRRTKGFSLVELLIAMAILISVLFIATSAYALFMQRWHSAKDRFAQAASETRNLLLLRQTVSSFYPYLVRDKQKKALLYFQGNRDSIVGITTQSLFNADAPALSRVRIEQQADLSYHLYYEEQSLDEVPFTYFERPVKYRDSLLLMTELSDAEFVYFGAESESQALKNTPNQWWQTFNSLNRRILPKVIRLSYVKHGQQTDMEFVLVDTDLSSLALFDDIH